MHILEKKAKNQGPKNTSIEVRKKEQITLKRKELRK